jgi:hypothetical protein
MVKPGMDFAVIHIEDIGQVVAVNIPRQGALGA